MHGKKSMGLTIKSIMFNTEGTFLFEMYLFFIVRISREYTVASRNLSSKYVAAQITGTLHGI